MTAPTPHVDEVVEQTSLAKADAPQAGRARLSGLDGLRAVAILCVIFYHLRTTQGWTFAAPLAKVFNNLWGVNLFFVLSGYLITWLLLGERERHGAINLKDFYARRAFRILPPAFAYLAVIVLLGLTGVLSITGRDLLTCVFFLRNYFTEPPFKGDVYADQTAHFWSLSVEEQFYLAWPMLLILVPAVWIRRGVWLGLPLVILATLAASRLNSPIISVVAIRTSGFIPIVVGCLLALYRDHWKATSSRIPALLRHGFVVFPILAFSLVAPFLPHVSSLASKFQIIAFAVLIHFVIDHPDSPVTRFLDLAPLRYLGRLSYSLYLWQQLFCWADPSMPRRGYETFPLALVLTFVTAVASHHLVELPLLRLRDRLLHR